jgi:hypothetical protein
MGTLCNGRAGRNGVCPHCGGHGYDLRDEDWRPVPCPCCNGSGDDPHAGLLAGVFVCLLVTAATPAGVAEEVRQ